MAEPHKILVVDDNATMLTLLESSLERGGYTVISAWNGETAIALAQEKKPHIIICDLMMPKMDGLTVLAALKALPDYEVPPFILLTAKADSLTKLEGLTAGAVEVLPKPTPARDIIALIEKLLGSAEAAKSDEKPLWSVAATKPLQDPFGKAETKPFEKPLNNDDQNPANADKTETTSPQTTNPQDEESA